MANKPDEYTDAEILAAHMDGYRRGEADGSGGRGYDTELSESIHNDLDWNRATGYDAGYGDTAGT